MESLSESNPPHIVVINAEAEFLKVVRVLLADEGFDVTTLHVDESPFDVIIEASPTVIVLDFVYERPEGWNLLALLDEDERTRTIPLLATSTDARIVEQVIELSSHRIRKALLVKPAELDDLLIAVHDLCGQLSPQ